MINMMFVEDFIIELAEKYNVSIEDTLDVFEDLGDDIKREPTPQELENELKELKEMMYI